MKWISLNEYEELVYKTIGDKPVIRMLQEQKIPFDKWKDNIHNLVDKELKATREVRVSLSSPAASTVSAEERETLPEIFEKWIHAWTNNDGESFISSRETEKGGLVFSIKSAMKEYAANLEGENQRLREENKGWEALVEKLQKIIDNL